MIIDKIFNLDRYLCLHPDFIKVKEVVEKFSDPTLEPGKYPIDGDRVFAVVQGYDTKEAQPDKFENHRKYIDIQYVIRGKEAFNCTKVSECTVTQEFDEKIDAALYTCEGMRTHVEAGDGDFVIFYPQDVHNPGVKYGDGIKIKKAIAKVML